MTEAAKASERDYELWLKIKEIVYSPGGHSPRDEVLVLLQQFREVVAAEVREQAGSCAGPLAPRSTSQDSRPAPFPAAPLELPNKPGPW